MADLSATFALDYWLVDGSESVTFRQQTAPAVYVNHAVGVAWERAPTMREVEASNGRYTRKDKVWVFPQSLLSVQPQPGDQLVHDALTYTVLDWEEGHDFGGDVWALTTRALAIAENLRDLLTVERPTYTRGVTGARVATWDEVYEAIPCRLQPIEGNEVTERGLVGQATRYRCFVDRQLSLGTEDRALVSGVYYEVRRYEQAERIEVLPVLTLERVP